MPKPTPPVSLARPLTTALVAWAAIGAGAVATAALFPALLQDMPFSDYQLALGSAAVSWLLLGAFLLLLRLGRINAANAVPAACFFLLGLLYVNFLRERAHYGDISAYVDAAFNLSRGEHLHARYIYPPLWAALLRPFVPLGQMGIRGVLWSANIAALFACYEFLRRTLERYGIGGNPAALVTALFLAVNVPLLRTLGYVQVNLHVLNLILACLLLYPRFRLLSALCLALAAHLKVAPALLVLPFVIARDLRWFGWFVATAAGVFAVTVLGYGLGPYADFLHNLGLVANPAITFYRDNSFDSFFRAVASLVGIAPTVPQLLAVAAKVALFFVALWISVRAAHRRALTPDSTVLNTLPVLLIPMTLLAPVVWEHHGVFLALPFLLVLDRTTRPGLLVLFGLAYFVEFLLPTFDFFPWSYGRLVAPLLLLYFLWRITCRPEPVSLFARLPAWLAARPGRP